MIITIEQTIASTGRLKLNSERFILSVVSGELWVYGLSIIPLNILNVLIIFSPKGCNCSNVVFDNLYAIPIAASISITDPLLISKNLFLSRIDFLEHSLKDIVHSVYLFIPQFKNMRTSWLEDWVLTQVAILMKEVLIENAEHSTAEMIRVLPFIGYLWIRER